MERLWALMGSIFGSPDLLSVNLVLCQIYVFATLI